MRRLIGAALLALALFGCRAQPRSGGHARLAELDLLTGLPLAFGEGFSLTAPSQPVMAALEAHYQVHLVDGPEQLRPRGLLLAAQPRALTAERLVALDGWVRGGGRLLLLADPRLTWPSELPLGDRQRPPYAYADTGLLAHWGLTLEAPPLGTAADVPMMVAGLRVTGDSPGRLRASGGSCAVAVDGRSARCRLGGGVAIIIADADFLRLPGGTEALLGALTALNR